MDTLSGISGCSVVGCTLGAWNAAATKISPEGEFVLYHMMHEVHVCVIAYSSNTFNETAEVKQCC